MGLKLNFNSATPLYSLVCLLASQGAPSVVGLGVITAAAATTPGYNTDFAFDLVGLAFPISALLQCFAGLMGASYAPISGFVGAVLLGVAGLLRVVFKKKFEGPEQVTPAVEA